MKGRERASVSLRIIDDNIVDFVRAKGSSRRFSLQRIDGVMGREGVGPLRREECRPVERRHSGPPPSAICSSGEAVIRGGFHEKRGSRGSRPVAEHLCCG